MPSPAVYDQARNPHRRRTVWSVRTVAAILANPRYTGWQVWNRQYTDHREAVPGDRRSSTGPVRVWNARSDWVVSVERTHPALVSDDDFAAAQRITAAARPQDWPVRRYAFTGLLICGVCGRRLVAHWVHEKPAYRCRHGRTGAHPRSEVGVKGVYWPQGQVFYRLRAWTTDLAFLQTPDDLAAFLRASDLVIVCGWGTVAIEAALSASIDEGPLTSGELDGLALAPIPEEGKERDPGPSGPVQLMLPFPAVGRRRGRGSLPPTSLIAQPQKQRTPLGFTPKRE
ncbi:recombinase family protein [Paractinoplanes durhamensis]|uniref:recombinase family protein n=1 Tax=Paractinoplanes durhamensis TaxID=113563 RepID=UPI0036447D94